MKNLNTESKINRLAAPIMFFWYSINSILVTMWTNYHMHSKYCDGKGELTDYVLAAKRVKMPSIGFSSHAPVPFDCKWCMKKENLERYFAEVDNVISSNPDIEIYKSLEIDFVPGIISPFQYKGQLHYLLGSIHFVDKFPDGRPWEVDGSHTGFLDGLQQLFNNNFKDAIVRYLELTREMIYHSPIDIVGHLDKIKMQNIDGKFFNENDKWYQDEVKKVLNLIAQANCILEVNTRGIYQKKAASTYPSPWILELAYQKNIRITLSSDAHHPDDIINQFPATAAMLSKIGFKRITVMKQGNWTEVPFNEHGITW